MSAALTRVAAQPAVDPADGHAAWIELDRGTWSPLPVFRHLADLGGHSLDSLEGAWNLGVGMFAVVSAAQSTQVAAALTAEGTSTVSGIGIIDRGYEGFRAKLAALGATVEGS